MVRPNTKNYLHEKKKKLWKKGPGWGLFTPIFTPVSSGACIAPDESFSLMTEMGQAH